MVKLIVRIFFGICLMLASAGLLVFNLFLLASGFDVSLALLDLLFFISGLLLTVFSVTALPSER